jgi:hypothetical protein
MPKDRHRRLAALLCLLASICPCDLAWGHPADQSDMRVRPLPNRLEVRFTFNLLTITKFIRVDANGDGNLDFAELKAAEQLLLAYLNNHIRLEVNQKPSRWGQQARFDYLWPGAPSTPPMPAAQYEGRNMDVTFDLAIEPVLEDFWIGFEVFEQTGTLQTIRGIYEQDGRLLDVPFSFEEPEYTYDTGFLEAPGGSQPMPPKQQESWRWIGSGLVALALASLVRRWRGRGVEGRHQ